MSNEVDFLADVGTDLSLEQRPEEAGAAEVGTALEAPSSMVQAFLQQQLDPGVQPPAQIQHRLRPLPQPL